MKRFLLILSGLLLPLALAAQTTLFLVGDSTCANKKLDKQNPERGWGQLFPALVDTTLRIENHAVNGRSTKSFRTEGRWQQVMDRVNPGDYVFIQFGHNDQKINDSMRYSSPAQYGENLRSYVREVRQKGANPVLLTPIVRRHWEGKTLLDSHGEYPEVMRRVAREEQVTLLEMEGETRRWLEELGDEASRDYFMWVEPGICPLYPDGRKDDTHLNVRGAHVVSRMVARLVEKQLPALAPHLQYPDWVVAKDGSGDSFTLREAVEALPDFSRDTTWLLVRAGTYREKISIPTSKRFVRMTGEGCEKTTITYDGYADRLDRYGRKMGTSGSSTIYFGGDHWQVEGITFENSAGPVGQAVSVQCLGSEIHFSHCRFLGWQDTLYLHGEGNRDGEIVSHNGFYTFRHCYVEGSTDFIFGSGDACFYDCEIHSKTDSYVTAASTCRGQKLGFLFHRCRLTAAPGVSRCYLGRPWRDYAQTRFVECWLGGHIVAEGWHNWSKPHAEKSVCYGEWANQGPGADRSQRVKWMEKPAATRAVAKRIVW